MSKTGSANGSFFGNFIYDQLLRRRPHFLSHLSRAVLGVASGLHPRMPRPRRPRKSWRERPKIEKKFAECKQFHGLRQARYWGLAKVTIQTLMVAMVVNLERWPTLLRLRSPASFWANAASLGTETPNMKNRTSKLLKIEVNSLSGLRKSSI
jgi:hypothetical protein